MIRHAVLATILMVAMGCDKAKELAGGARAQAAVPASDQLDLSTKPEILFQVFGERDDPRMIPIATIDKGRLKPIVLSAAGWKQFDAIYMRSGTSYSLFRDGRPAGTVEVRQGMWEKSNPLYSLPRCELLTPLAAVTMDGSLRTGYTVEYLASTAALGSAPAGKPFSSAEAETAARALAGAVGIDAGIPRRTLDSLDFRAVSIMTGTTGAPTIVASYVDPGAEMSSESAGRTAHVFAIGDQDQDGGYQATFTHTVNGPATSAEYRRFVDHLDVDSDGVDEIVLEGWESGGETFLSVLAYDSGRWRETYRARSSWCLDGR